MAITAVVNSKESASTIHHTIRSVAGLADELVVLDMGSEDGTIEVAAGLGARVVEIQPQPMVELTRERGLEEASNEWVLVLDADEMVTPRLCAELREIVDKNTVDAVRMPFVNFFIGAPMRYGSSSPHHDRHLRFFRKHLIVHGQGVHTEPKLVAGARLLDMEYEPGIAIVHFNYVDMNQYIDKMNRYTSLEAERAAREHGTWSLVRTLWEMTREILIRLVLRQGFRDGWRGVHQALLMVVYRYLANAKHWERERVGTRAQIQAGYDEIAERVLEGEPI